MSTEKEPLEALADRLKKIADGLYQADIESALAGDLYRAVAAITLLEPNSDRWIALCNLWAASTELRLAQDEDGGWSITQEEPAENIVFKPLKGATPDDAIDLARSDTKQTESPAEQVPESARLGANDKQHSTPARSGGPSAVEEPLPESVQKEIDAHARWYAEYHNLGLSARDDMMHVAALARAAERESAATPNETVLQTIRRVLDESSAWIAMPNKDVEKRLAIASGFAWQAEHNRLHAENERLTAGWKQAHRESRSFFARSCENLQRAERAEAALRGGVVVPKEPPVELLISMALRINHGFGLDDQRRQEVQIAEMRKVYEEVVGEGFYSDENKGRYAALAAAKEQRGGVVPHPDTLYVVWFEDADVRPEVFFGAGARDAAIKFYTDKIASWSCHLLMRMPEAMLAAAKEGEQWVG